MPKEFDIKKYSKLFVSEAREALKVSNDAMLELEKDPSRKDLVDQIFRNCHTIKGMAGMMNIETVTDTAHAIEDILAAVRDGRLEPRGNIIEGLFKGLDALEAMVTSVEKSELIPEDPKLIIALQGLMSESTTPAPEKKKDAPVEPAEAKAGNVSIGIKLGRRCALPSARAMVILKELGKTSIVVSSTPGEEEIEHEEMFEELTVEVEPGARFQESVRRIAGMTDVEEVHVGGTNEPRSSWKKVSDKEGVAPGAVTEAAPAHTVKVGMDKLDDLLDDVGELVIGRSRLLEKAAAADDYELQDITTLIDKLTSQIQSKVLGIRMIPLDIVMSRFPRMVRDLAKSQDKEVELVVEGGGIELDRTVIDKITEPMMHLLRNCVDHGIESVAAREKAGKRPKGLIRIVASKQQDHVLIEVSDDGRGIDLEEVKKAAIRKGVLTQAQAEAALGREVIDLLFRPGFSTKTEVTEVSGRGVGLDIVKSRVQELGGSVIVNTTKGAGTTFSLWLPFTLAIIEAMLIEIADQAYAVPMGTMIESHKFEESEVKLIRSREVVQLRGEVLPLIRMHEFFGVKEDKKKDSMDCLVVQSRDRRAALEVDDLLGHQQIVVKALDKRLRGVKGISGGTILGSGKIALILDVDSIIGE